ncbi:hypothetical protein B566_EDAN012703 [Ephemera danica]|nr:hypothetical protein B566_EDAN012703 [Ephemera danica]
MSDVTGELPILPGARGPAKAADPKTIATIGGRRYYFSDLYLEQIFTGRAEHDKSQLGFGATVESPSVFLNGMQEIPRI